MKNKNIYKLTQKLHIELDDILRKYKDEFSYRIACKSGCSLCCKVLRVEIFPTEASYITKYIKSNYTKKQLDILKNNLTKTINKKDAIVGCPLLIDNICSIYPVRPFVCRIFLSDNYQICELQNCKQGHNKELMHKVASSKILSIYEKNFISENIEMTPIEINKVLYSILITPQS